MFDAVDKLDVDQDSLFQDLQSFSIGSPWKLSPGDEKLRLLGYPSSGGFTLSVLTGFFTSFSYDNPNTSRGCWLNINISLPHGGSGGAAVNTKGQLVGVCTQTRRDLTNIRSITETRFLIDTAKALVKEAQENGRPPDSTGLTSLFSVQNTKVVLGVCRDSRRGSASRRLLARPCRDVCNLYLFFCFYCIYLILLLLSSINQMSTYILTMLYQLIYIST